MPWFWEMGALSPKETTFWQVQRMPSWGHNFVAMLPSQRQRNRQYTLSKSIIFRVVSCKKKDNTFPKQKSNSKIHKRVLHTLKLWSLNHIKGNLQAFCINPWKRYFFISPTLIWLRELEHRLAQWVRFLCQAWLYMNFIYGPDLSFRTC